MSTEAVFYVLTYCSRPELRIGICTNWPAFLAHIESHYMNLDLEASLIAAVSTESAERLRLAVHSRLAPAYTVPAFPVEDAYGLREDYLVRTVLRQQRVKTKRLSTVLQSEGPPHLREQWRSRNEHLRKARSWQRYREAAHDAHQRNEKTLQRIEDFVSGLQTHAEVLYVHPEPGHDTESLEIYAVANTSIGAMRLKTYIETHDRSPPIGHLELPGGLTSFLTGGTGSYTPERTMYVQTLTTSFRRYTQRLTPHITAGLEVILSRLHACPAAPTELRNEKQAIQRHLWDALSGDVAEEPPPQTLN